MTRPPRHRPRPAPKLSKPVALVGMMGAGKSVIGRRLAKRLAVPFFDADREIETAAGRSVADIFTDFGEEEFRRGERAVITRLVQEGLHVLALGGGAFLNAETRELLHAKATTVWLKADLDTLVERVSRRDTRPLLHNRDPQEVLSKLMHDRDPIYAQADLSVESSDGPPDRVVEAILKLLRTVG